jgi:hypothetical protein
LETGWKLSSRNINEIREARDKLRELLPHYISAETDERAAYFRGLMVKAADSLAAIDLLLTCSGPVWLLHCRWILEAFAHASALQADDKVLDQIKRLGANTYLLVADVDDVTRNKKLDVIGQSQLPTIETLFQKFEREAGASETGLLYKVYRLLSEYTHFEFYRTIAYPDFGVDPPEELEKRKNLFLKITVAAALSLPSFAHCPPSCGFDDEHFEKITALRENAWREIQALN